MEKEKGKNGSYDSERVNGPKSQDALLEVSGHEFEMTSVNISLTESLL